MKNREMTESEKFWTEGTVNTISKGAAEKVNKEFGLHEIVKFVPIGDVLEKIDLADDAGAAEIQRVLNKARNSLLKDRDKAFMESVYDDAIEHPKTMKDLEAFWVGLTNEQRARIGRRMDAKLEGG